MAAFWRVDSRQNISWQAGLLLTAALLFVWPIGHTVALRHALLVAALLILLVIGEARRLLFQRSFWKESWFVLLALFVLWALLQALLIAPDPSRALGEIRGQLVPALASGLLGGLLAAGARGTRQQAWLWRSIVLMLAVHALATLWTAMGPALQGGTLLRRVGGLTEGPDKSNYLTVTLTCMVLVAAVSGRAGFRRLVPLPAAIFLGALAAAALYVEQIRNGVVSLGAAAMVLMLFLVTQPGAKRSRKIGLIFVMLLALLVLLALARTDPRWAHTVETVQRAWQSDTRAVVLGDPRALTGGDPSAFLRLAMLKEGAKIVAHYPWGIGFDRNAFGHGLRLVYGEGSGHSHSSLLDIAIGTGIPGVLLLVGFFAALIHAGWQAERRNPDGFGLLLLLLATATLARSALDSCLRDHMLQESFFLFGVLVALIQVRRNTPEQPAP